MQMRKMWKDYKELEVVNNSKETFSRQNRTETHELTETKIAHVKPTQVHTKQNSIPEKWKWAPRSYLKLIPAGEISFLQRRVTGYIKHIPGWALCPGRVGQNKMDSMVLYVHAFVLLLLYFLILLSF